MEYRRGLVKVSFFGKALQLGAAALTGTTIAGANHAKNTMGKASNMFKKPGVNPIKNAKPLPKPSLSVGSMSIK